MSEAYVHINGNNNTVNTPGVIRSLVMHGENNHAKAANIKGIGASGKGSVIETAGHSDNVTLNDGVTLKSEDGLVVDGHFSGKDSFLEGKMNLGKNPRLQNVGMSKLAFLDTWFGWWKCNISKSTTLPPTCNMTPRTIASLPAGRKVRAATTFGWPNYTPAPKRMKIG